MATSRDSKRKSTAQQSVVWHDSSGGILPGRPPGIYIGVSNELHVWMVAKPAVLIMGTGGFANWLATTGTLLKISTKDHKGTQT